MVSLTLGVKASGRRTLRLVTWDEKYCGKITVGMFFHCSGRTNLNLQVRSDKVDRYVRVELSHELSEKHTQMTRAFIQSVMSMCPDHELRILQISTCMLRRGRRTAPQPELQWQWPRSPVAPLTLPWQTIDPCSAQIWAPYLHCCCSFCTDG